MSNQQQQAGVELSDDSAISAVFKKWAGANENGVAYLTVYEESFKHIAHELLAAERQLVANCQQRGKVEPVATSYRGDMRVGQVYWCLIVNHKAKGKEIKALKWSGDEYDLAARALGNVYLDEATARTAAAKANARIAAPQAEKAPSHDGALLSTDDLRKLASEKPDPMAPHLLDSMRRALRWSADVIDAAEVVIQEKAPSVQAVDLHMTGDLAAIGVKALNAARESGTAGMNTLAYAYAEAVLNALPELYAAPQQPSVPDAIASEQEKGKG